MFDSHPLFLLAVALVSGFVASGAKWSIARRLKDVAPAEWTRLGSPDVRRFRIHQSLSYEFAQTVAGFRLAWRVFKPGAFGVRDKSLARQVWIFRISTVVMIPSQLLFVFLFLTSG
ncbi:hypothetical protein V5F29_08055 [Xanthobacter aminoxidans]|jgi:hypothetical protein|uniref:hypothetical protein n=1 Tax=Xanthobacter aminoxidans TaxID=186280 RepID=UPI00372C8856